MNKLIAFDINETITEGDSYHKSNQSDISLNIKLLLLTTIIKIGI